MTGSATRRQHVAVAAAFCIIALMQTWPLVTQLATVLPNDPGDPVLNAWILRWNAHALPLTRDWWNAPMFYPAPGAIAFSEVLLGQSIVASPLQWFGASPITAYNVVFLLSFPLSAFSAYLLVWTLTRRVGASLVAGVLFGCAAFRFAHVPHIQILWTFWMPLGLLGLHQWIGHRRPGGLVLFASAWVGQSLSNGYYFFYFSITVALWLAWFTKWRDLRRTLLPPLVAWVVAAVLIAPVLLGYRHYHEQYQFSRTEAEIESGGADLTEFFRPSSIPRFLGVARWERGEHEVSLPLIGIVALAIGLLGGARGGLVRRPWRHRNRRELTLWAMQIALWTVAAACALVAISTQVYGNWHFDQLGVHVSGIAKMLGVTWPAAIAGLALSPAIGRAWRERSIPAFYLGATIVSLILAMGPNPRAWGEKFWNDAPYGWLMAVMPGVDGVRVPGRFAMLTVLCLAVFTALLLARVRLAPAHQIRERMLVAAFVAVALFETWPTPIPMVPLPARGPEIAADSSVIELPFGVDQELPALYRSMLHRRPLVNGYSGYFPLSHTALRLCLARKGAECLTTLERIVGPLEIVVEREADPTGEWQAYARQLPGVEKRTGNAAFALYHLGGSATKPDGLVAARIKSSKGTVEPNHVALAFDGSMRTTWTTMRGQATNDAVTIETDPAQVAGVALWLNPSTINHYPRGLRIETSEDGAQWTHAWEDTTQRVLFETMLAYGLPGTRVTFPARQARFVRLTETLTDAEIPWSIAELTILRTP